MSAEEVWADPGAGLGLQVDEFALKTDDPAQVFLQTGGAARIFGAHEYISHWA